MIIKSGKKSEKEHRATSTTSELKPKKDFYPQNFKEADEELITVILPTINNDNK